MADIKSVDRIKLERYLSMSGGFVCNFSDRTFRDFILECTGVDVYGQGYDEGGTSKANRFRTFWKKESNYLTAKVLLEMAKFWKSEKEALPSAFTAFDPSLYEDCLKIISALESNTPITDITALQPNSTDKSFSILAISIQESIKKNEPDQALDRLHTFVTKYLRELCSRHSIAFNKDTALHSLMGSYVKFLQTNQYIDSGMTERILKSSISILEAFNDVRNNQSFAHDNNILNYSESVLIFNNISNTIRFIDSIEKKIEDTKKEQQKTEVNWEDLPF